MISVSYALQTCDSFNNQIDLRYTGTPKKDVTIKCTTSFFRSLEYAANKNLNVQHNVIIFDDRSSDETFMYLHKLASKYSKNNISVTVKKTSKSGIMESIRECYEWLLENGKDFVYQVQDDYLFSESCIYEIIEVWYQIYNETKSHAIISPFNDHHLWLGSYRNRTTPRAIICGTSRYWIQYYDASCSFFTSANNFIKHWDYLEAFLRMPPTGDDQGNFENTTINRIFVERGVLGLVPIPSLALHMQSEIEIDPYVDWKSWWDSVEIIK